MQFNSSAALDEAVETRRRLNHIRTGGKRVTWRDIIRASAKADARGDEVRLADLAE